MCKGGACARGRIRGLNLYIGMMVGPKVALVQWLQYTVRFMRYVIECDMMSNTRLKPGIHVAGYIHVAARLCIMTAGIFKCLHTHTHNTVKSRKLLLWVDRMSILC